jgi:hypothetical protein
MNPTSGRGRNGARRDHASRHGPSSGRLGRHWHGLAAGGACALVSLAAPAQTIPPQQDPAYVGVQQAVSHESNVFRTPDGAPRADDTYYTTSLLGGLDLRFGRQRGYGVLSLSNVNFRDNSQLDHVAYALNAGLDWETIGNLSGKLDFTRNRGLADYGDDGNPLVFDRNLEISQQATAIARVGVVTRLTLEGQLQRRDVSYSAASFDFREFNQDAASVTLRYQVSGALTVGGGLRYTRGEFPRYLRLAGGGTQADEYRRRDVDLTVDWVPTGLSTVSARLSAGEQDNTQATQNDFSGVTGALTWLYQPTGKLQFTTLLIRDTGAESRFVNFGPSESARTDTSRLSSTARLGVRYDATAKIQLRTGLQLTHRSLRDSILQTGNPNAGAGGTDDYGRLEFGVRYLPTRSVALECAAFRERRRSDTSLSYPYSLTGMNCLARLKVAVL